MPRSKMVKPTKKQILDVLKRVFNAYKDTPEEAETQDLTDEAAAILKAYKLV